MWILVIALVILAIVALIAGHLRNVSLQKKIDKGEIAEMPDLVEVDSECCGQHEVCEKDSLLAALSKEIEYYDDEELDEFAGRDSADYSPEEAEKFRDVLYTMRETEVAGWVRSLQLRKVNLPDEIKEEVFLIIGERRLH